MCGHKAQSVFGFVNIGLAVPDVTSAEIAVGRLAGRYGGLTASQVGIAHSEL